MRIENPIKGNLKKNIGEPNILLTSHPSSLSFKGSPTNIINSQNVATLINASDEKIINIFSTHYGDIATNIGKKLGGFVTNHQKNYKILEKSSRFCLEKGITSIQDKKMGRSIMESLLFPFLNLPLYAGSWVLDKAKSTKIPKVSNTAKTLYYNPIFRIPRKLNDLDSRTDILKGIYNKTKTTIDCFAAKKGIEDSTKLIEILNGADNSPQTQKLAKEANEYIKENLYKVSNKFFDKYTGNFNTAYERPLNRIVSGLIPVAFLANDAYNLSVLCGDDKKTSKKEAAERRKQEISRVFSTAYIQLLTFGACTKQVNTIAWFTPLTSAITVLFSEITSRMKLNKPIFFLNKQKAKEYNRKYHLENNIKNATPIQENKENKNIKIDSISYLLDNREEAKVFTSFKSSNIKTNTQNATTETKQEKKEEQKKALINFKTFKKAVGILITAGFVLSIIKNSSLTKNNKIVKGVQDFGKSIKDKVYNPLVFKDFEISETQFNEIMNSLKNSGCKEIAEGHEFIQERYGKKTADGIIKMYKSSLSSKKTSDVISSALQNIKNINNSLTDKEYKIIEDSIKTSIKVGADYIAENKTNDIAHNALTIMKNKQIEFSKDDIEKIENIISKSINDNLTKNIPIQIEKKSKPFVDILTQPFKFAMSALKLPFKITKTLINLMVTPVEQKVAKAKFQNIKLSKLEKGIHKAITEIFGENSSAITKAANEVFQENNSKSSKISQVIFTNAIEELQKRTAPYRKAEKALQEAIKNGKPSTEINNARLAVKNAAEDLKKYVNNAIEKSFNGITQSSNKNTDLAIMSKLASSAVTSAFLVADNYNMVMLKSDGEDIEDAKEKANERIIQRLSALFYQTLFINWFNGTFRSTYNSSLKGMTAVVVPNTLTTEIVTRKSIGMPIGKKTYKELQELDEKNENRKGFIGKYFKFMRLLTGKKPLKDRIPKDKQNLNIQNKPETTVKSTETSANNTKNQTTTNLIELLSKK